MTAFYAVFDPINATLSYASAGHNPPRLLRCADGFKMALNRAQKAAGLLEAVEANLDLSALLNGAQTPEQEAFDELVRTEGVKAALAWRDKRYGEILGELGAG